MKRIQSWTRSARVVALGASAVAVAGGVALAATLSTNYNFQFTIPGGGGYACTSQTRTASTYAPNVFVYLSKVGNNSGSQSANFSVASPNCVQLPHAATVTLCTQSYAYCGAQGSTIYAGDKVGQQIKVWGQTGPFQGSPQVYGYWHP